MNKTLYVGLDVQADTIAVAVADEGRNGEVRFFGTIANRADSVSRLAKRLTEAGQVPTFRYEAGPRGYTTARDHVRPRRLSLKEVLVPPTHPPGHAQADFGEAWTVPGGVRRKVHVLVVDLPRSDAIFPKAYHSETAEALCDGHVAAFDFFGGAPLSMLCDNTKLAVAKVSGLLAPSHDPVDHATASRPASEAWVTARGCAQRCSQNRGRIICSATASAGPAGVTSEPLKAPLVQAQWRTRSPPLR